MIPFNSFVTQGLLLGKMVTVLEGIMFSLALTTLAVNANFDTITSVVIE